MTPELTRSFRELLLPYRKDREDEAIKQLVDSAVKSGIAVKDIAVWIDLKANDWRNIANPDPSFQTAVECAVTAGDGQHGGRIADAYFGVHSKLMDRWGFTHDEARWFLSHSCLLAALASDHQMSAAQIANIVNQKDRRAMMSWRTVSTLLTPIGLKPETSAASIDALFTQDEIDEESILADASIEEAAVFLALRAQQLGFPYDMEHLLLRLARSDNFHSYVPYLQILHYQCCIAEEFDHDLSVLYEFSPRGAAVLDLCGKYPDSMVSAGNPFLNNAKSVEKADFDWAISKENLGALALVELLTGLTQMGFTARRDLCSLVRFWIHRVIRVALPASVTLPAQLTDTQIELLVNGITANETNTAGVIEQRIVDAYSVLLHKNSDGWRSRGLGDSVNATNVSRKKLGDCDFQNLSNNIVVAYEAHAGPLTEQYLASHMITLPKLLKERIREWNGYSVAEDWTVHIVFVAHEIKATKPAPITIDGVTVHIELEVYRDFFSKTVAPTQSIIDSISKYVLTPLTENHTPNSTREKLNQIAGV